MAQCAWNAAYQASMMSAKPGIAAVRGVDELAHCVSGLYILNPRLSHSPTLFMGVWPVANLAAISWDGVFFFGPAWPEHPTPPPVPCPRPDPPEPPHPPHPDVPDEGHNGNGPNPPWKPCARA